MSAFDSKIRLSNNTQCVVSSTSYLSSISKQKSREATPSTISTKGTSTTISLTPEAHGLYSSCNKHIHQAELKAEIGSTKLFKDGNGTRNSNIPNRNIDDQKKKATQNDPSDILAQWRRERQDQRLKDKENFPNGVDVTHVHISDNSQVNDDATRIALKDKHREIDVTSKISSFESLQALRLKIPGGPSSDNDGARNQNLSSERTIDHGGTEGVDTSVTTTPTGNTAINSIGLERLHKKHSSRVRLFPASQDKFHPDHKVVHYEKTSPYDRSNKAQELIFKPSDNSDYQGNEGDSIDVSLMTQDTDMIFLENAIRDASTKPEMASNNSSANLDRQEDKDIIKSYELQSQKLHHGQIPNRNTSNNDPNCNDSNHTCNTSSSENSCYHGNNTSTCTNENDFALTILRSSLDQSRIIRAEQEKELLQNKDEMAQLRQQNHLAIKESQGYKISLRNRIGELIQHIIDLQDCLKFDDDTKYEKEDGYVLKCLESSGDETTILQEISDVMNEIVINKMPHLVEKTRENTNKVQAAKAELKRVCTQVRKAKICQEEQIWQHEEEWKSRQQQMNQEHNKIQNQIKDGKKKLDMLRKDILHFDEVSSQLHDTQQELEQHKITLSNITTQVSEKRIELADIEKICDERIQSAHRLENDARESVEAARNEKIATSKLHDESVKRLDTIKSVEKAAQIERRDLDSDRLAWDKELKLKRDQMANDVERLEEERQRLKGIEESLTSRKIQVEEESDKVKSVKNQLLEIEAVTEEKLLILDEKNAEMEKREAEICHAEGEIAERRKKFDIQLQENETRSNELLSVEADLKNQFVSLKQDKEEFEKEQHNFSERLNSLEEREKELESDRNELTTKASKLSDTVKAAKEDTEKRRQQLDQLEHKLNEKEKSIAQQANLLLAQEKEVMEDLKKIAVQKEDIINDKIRFEKSLKEEKAEHSKALTLLISNQAEEQSKLNTITQKKIETEKSYKKLLSDVKKVKEAIQNKVNEAQSEYKGIESTVALKKQDLAGLQEMVQNLCKEVDDSKKMKDETTESIRKKEKKLLKLDAQLKSAKEDWDRVKQEKEDEMKNILLTKTQAAEKEFTIIQDQAISKIKKMSNDFAFKHEEATCKLSSRARQLDLLHSKLSKVTRRTFNEQKQVQEDRRAWEDEKSRIENILKENLESIRHKDDEISSYVHANKALKASLESSTKHELLLTESLQAKDKEINLVLRDKKELDQRVKDYEDKLSNLARSSAELEKVYEEKISSLKFAAERDSETARIQYDKDKRVLEEKLKDYEHQLITFKSSTVELEKVYEEKISLIKVTAERDMKLAVTRCEAKVTSLGKIDDRMKELYKEESRLEKERGDLLKRANRLQKREDHVNNRITQIERKESELEEEAKEIRQSKLILQEERQQTITKIESLRQEETKLQDEKLTFSAHKESCRKEVRKETKKLEECRRVLDLKEKQISEREESLEKRAAELKELENSISNDSMESNKKVTEVQTNLIEQENELKAAKMELSDKIKSINDLEEDLKNRTISQKRQEEEIISKFNEIYEKEEHVTIAQQSLNEERKLLSTRLKELKTKEEEMDSRILEIRNQQTSNTEISKRLKEFAQSLKKKEKNIQKVAISLKEQQTKSSSSDATLIAELQNAVSIGQKQYQELVEINTKQKEDLRAKEEQLNQEKGGNTNASEESQQRMRQLALQLKKKADELKKREEALEEKAEELNKKEEVLAERILQCEECESTLAAWNMNLDGMTPTFDGTPENNAFRS